VSFLRSRGHDVEALTTASAAPSDTTVHWVSRRLPAGVRHAVFALRLAKLARGFDVIYTMSVLGRSAAGARAARTPYVVKLPDDPAYERARRLAGFRGSLEEFQSAPGARLQALRFARTAALRGAARIICPSEYLRALALGWGFPPEGVVVLPNPAPEVPALPPADEVRRKLELNGQLLVFAGRMNAQKSLEVALDALAGTEATLLLLGDGPDRPGLEEKAAALGLDSRARFLGPQPRERVLELFRAADASLLSSSWENFPHTVVESLAVGTPVISTAVGGVPEVVRDGTNGLLVAAGDSEGLADAIRRFFGDEALRQRLRAGAAGSLQRFAPERVYTEIERVLHEAAG
jgi:glycosyltransferase involved in cell wall biosynthesis